MAQSQGVVENTFIQGLISEATGLNFPKDACTDAINCSFDSKGIVTRRKGIDYETGYSTATVTRSSSTVSEYVWRSVSGDGNRSFAVVQIGSTLHFYEIPASGALSANKKSFTVDLAQFAIAGAPSVALQPCQFASGYGDLFVVHPNCDPFYVSYDATLNTVTSTKITVKIRDLIGIEENIAFNVRPATISHAHKYNLFNQGWYVGLSNVLDVGGSTPSTSQWVPYELWENYAGSRKAFDGYPSNADVWWYYKDTTGVFSAKVVENQGKTPPSAPAPKGHYIVKAFQQYKGYCKIAKIVQLAGATTATVTLDEGVPFKANSTIVIEGSSIARFNGTFTITSIGSSSTHDTFVIPITGSTAANTDNGNANLYCYLANSVAAFVTSGVNRPSCVSFYAGRVWYGGTSASDFNDKIYFSKIIEQPSDYGRCFQVNDPTSEENSDLLPSDGGVISVPEMGNLIRMVPVGQDLILFASNGVWGITGSQGFGFTANDYSVRKLSSVPSISASSFVISEGSPIFWNIDGIYAVASGQNGDYAVQAISDKSIKSWYGNIPVSSKVYAKGVYNSLTRTVQWIYRSTAGATTDDLYQYDRVLCLNTLTGAFYPWSIQTATGYPTVNGVLTTDNTSTTGSITKFVTTRNVTETSYALTFSEEQDTGYVDWETPDVGLQYTSSFSTGFRLPGEGLRQQFGNYINVFCNCVTNSSVKLRAKWDYSNSSSSGEWSSEQEVYVARDFRDTLRRRVKVRGRGIACQLSFRSTAGKPFSIIGWSMVETANQAP